MPAPSDDDIFKRMFASFVARKTRSSTPNTAAPNPRPPFIDRPPVALRKDPADFTARGLSASATSPNLAALRYAHQSRHPTTSNKHGRHDSKASAFPSFFNLRHAPDVTRAHGNSANQTSKRHSSKGSKGSRGSKSSKGSKGSKGSEKQVSASTEDAPPRKRTRTHAALQRSQSAHAGSLHTSRSKKPEKVRTNSRFNLPPAHTSGSGAAAAGKSGKSGKSGSASKATTKSFPCDKCSATFAQKGQLSRHIRRVHEKLRPHACEHCGRLFGARSDRTRHVMIVHKKVRQFPCERCGFQFQAKTHLEAHVRTVHEGERPYRCSQCGFSFGLRSNLLTHERAVHYREAKWNCTVCDTAFNRKHDMFRHMKLMHDIDSSGQSGSHGKKAHRQ